MPLLNLKSEEFEAAVTKPGITFVDFWAAWCGPCRMIGPMVDELSSEYAGKAVIGKLNVDENPDISMNYGVRSIPTLLIFKNGQLVDKIVGAVPKQNIASKIDAQL